MSFYPDRHLIIERIYNGIISGNKWIHIMHLENPSKDWERKLFRKFPSTNENKHYLLDKGKQLLVNLKARKVVDIVLELGFDWGTKSFDGELAVIIDYEDKLQGHIEVLRKMLIKF